MKHRFGYCCDPLFIVGCIVYVLNRWIVKPHVHGGVFHSHFNDFWLIPCALPPVLWIYRRLGLREDDARPRGSEILQHLVFWSLLFEGIGPRFMSHTTGDARDVAAYALGALCAALWWSRERWLLLFRPVHEL